MTKRPGVSTAELTDAVDVEPTTFARQMAGLGCKPTRNRVPTEDGETRRIRGYLTADIRTTVTDARYGDNGRPPDIGSGGWPGG